MKHLPMGFSSVAIPRSLLLLLGSDEAMMKVNAVKIQSERSEDTKLFDDDSVFFSPIRN